jgi:hypothetical protein
MARPIFYLLPILLCLSCIKKRELDSPIRERVEILSEEEVEEFPEAGEFKE